MLQGWTQRIISRMGWFPVDPTLPPVTWERRMRLWSCLYHIIEHAVHYLLVSKYEIWLYATNGPFSWRRSQLKTFLHHSHHYLLPHGTSVISVQRRRHNNYGSKVQEHSTHNIYMWPCLWKHTTCHTFLIPRYWYRRVVRRSAHLVVLSDSHYPIPSLCWHRVHVTRRKQAFLLDQAIYTM